MSINLAINIKNLFESIFLKKSISNKLKDKNVKKI